MADSKISVGTVLSLAGLALMGFGAWVTLSNSLAAVEARTTEHERRLEKIEATAKETGDDVATIQVDIAGIATDVRYLRQAFERDKK